MSGTTKDGWVKKEAGTYVRGTVRIMKTYSRSGWWVFCSRTKFHGYAETLARAKDMAEFNGLFSKPLIDIL